MFTSSTITILVFADLPRHEGLVRKYEALAIAASDKGYTVDLVIRPHTVAGALSLFFRAISSQGDFWIRFSSLYLSLLPALVYRKLKGSKILLEIPTPLAFPRFQSAQPARNLGSVLTWAFSFLSQKPALYLSDLEATYVPAPVMEKERVIGSRKPFLLSNWANFPQIKLAQSPTRSSVLRMIFVANISIQHGLDRVLLGMKAYEDALLTVIGAGRELAAQKALADTLGLSDRVCFTGALHGSALDEAFEEQDVALSSFGYHRIGIEAGSPLKTREYAARGLPVVGAYQDTAIPEGSAFPFLRLPADDEPIDLALVHKFALKHQNRAAVRASGEKLFDVRYVIKAIL